MNALAWSHGLERPILASCSSDATIRIWDVETGKCKEVLREHKGDVICLKFCPKDRFLASGDLDGRLALWTVPKFEVKALFQHTDHRQLQNW